LDLKGRQVYAILYVVRTGNERGRADNDLIVYGVEDTGYGVVFYHWDETL